MIAALRRRLAAYRRARALLNFRETFAMFGYDLSDLTDEQIEQGATRATQAIASAGVPCGEAAENLARAVKGADYNAQR